MRMRLLAGIVLLIIAVAGLSWWFLHRSPAPATSASKGAQKEIRLTPRQQMTTEQAAATKQRVYAPEVESVLSEKEMLLRPLAADPITLAATRSANQHNAAFSMADITTFDQAWIASKTPTSLAQTLLSNDASKLFLNFQTKHPEFKEIFVADARGLNVAETDLTSDYYQADESWWVQAFSGGRGQRLHGALEFDKSAQTEAISLYLPIIDGGHAIGVMKGVVNISGISTQL